MCDEKEETKKNQRFDEKMTKHQKPEIRTQENIENYKQVNKATFVLYYYHPPVFITETKNSGQNLDSSSS